MHLGQGVCKNFETSHSSGLFSLGTLLLENSILKNVGCEEHVSKKLKTDRNLNDSWTQLAELYSALNESDVVNGILQEKVSSNTSSVMKEGLGHEQAGNMTAAMETYKKGLRNFVQQTTKSYEEHFITEAFFKCANYLSMFDEINNYVVEQFDNLDTLWKDNWDIEHTLPWFFTSEAYLRIEDDREFSVLDSVLGPWLEDKNKGSLMTNLVAEQMAVLFVCLKENSKASLVVKDCLKFLMNDWNSSKISLNHFHRLQILAEINTMIEILNDSSNDVDVKINDLLRTWKHCVPGKNDINFWDRRIMNRTLFIQKFSSELPIDDELREQLTDSRIVLKFHVLENALDRGNHEMAYKYFISLHNKEFSVEDEDEPVVPDKFANRFYLNLSKICMSKKDSAAKVANFFLCLDFLETGKINSGYEYFAHLAEVMSKILDNISLFFVTQDSEEKLISQLRRVLDKPDLCTENLLHEVSVGGVLENLEKSATLALNENRSRSEISSVYLTMAKYCKKFVNDEPGSLIYEENLTRSLLKALKFGSKESQILFPTLLHLSHITSDSVMQVFLSESDKVEEWKYLPWVHQLLAYVSTDSIFLIENILRKIVERYPNSLQFTLYSTIKNINSSSWKTRKLIDDLQQKVDPYGKVLKLIETFSHIRSPDSFFDHWLTQLWKITKRSNMPAELNALEEQLMQEVGSRGELFTAHPLLRSFNECIEKLKSNAENKSLVEKTVVQLKNVISESQNRPLCDRHELLELYSPACSQFTEWCGDNIEIPGQYDGFSIPVPENHVKMHSFHKRVKVLISKQKPIRVKIIGNDAKKYAYLVKFEDDMRQDQRIQQIFSLINQCASSDDTNTKNLSVITYGVYPLEVDFGIIEWVEKTTTLKEFLDYGLSNDEKTYWRKRRADLIGEYHHRLSEQFVSHNFGSEMELVYEEAVKKYNKNFVVSSFQRCCREIPEKVFRNALLALGNSPSVFWNLRNTFMRAYSAMCIYGWMLGIGDRHLKNTLVCLKTGNCIGIDFGYAFGAGVECTRIPELIPFRMTPHIQSIMAPMYLTGLIRETMIATLKKFRENEQVLVAALQIFILEPAFNSYWFNSAKKRLEENENVDELRFYPAEKIDTIKSKLMGTNPAVILIDEIRKNQVINAHYKAALIKLVSERNRSVEDNLIVSAQVDQLLHLATDEGILGISWCGLETYI